MGIVDWGLGIIRIIKVIILINNQNFHYFVEIDYRCSNCGKIFYKVYQWWDDDEIVSNFEYCSNYDNNRRKSGRNLSYNTIESLFDTYKRRSYNNCQFFANSFYDAIVNY